MGLVVMSAMNWSSMRQEFVLDTRRFLAMIGDAKPHDVDYPLNKQKLDWRKEAEELYDKMGVKLFAIQEHNISGEK